MSDAPNPPRAPRARGLRRRGNVALSVLLWVAAILLVLIVLGRNDAELDVSQGKRRSLAPQTLRVLELMDRPVHVLAFYKDVPEDRVFAESLLERYQAAGDITYEFVDLDQRPELAELYGVSLNRTQVLTSEGLQIKLREPDEPELTAGLLRLVMDQPPRVLFVTGHGEASLTDQSGRGLSRLGELIAKQNFLVEEIHLPGADRIPADAAAVILAAPEGSFSARELNALGAYALQGGSLLAMLEPLGSANADSLIALFGVVADDAFIVDPSDERQNITGRGGFRIALAAGGNPEHPVTQGFTFAVLFPIARSLGTVQPPPPGVTPTRLLQSMDSAWAESDLTQIADGAPEFVDGEDRGGPVGLAYAVELDLRRFQIDPTQRGQDMSALLMDFYPETYDLRGQADTLRVGGEQFAAEVGQVAKLGVIGDVDFVNNANLLAYGNSDFFLGMLLWLTQQEERIALAPRPDLFDPVVLTQNQTMTMRVVFIGVLPLLFFTLAAGVVWRRRHWI